MKKGWFSREENMRSELIFALFALAIAAGPAAAGDREDCFAGKDDQRRITACSALIAGEPGNAILYHHRGPEASTSRNRVRPRPQTDLRE
jgi:hypothetical protein